MTPAAKQSWYNLKANQVLFFVCLDKSQSNKRLAESTDDFAKSNGLKLVRGCIVKKRLSTKKIVEVNTSKQGDNKQ